MNIEERTSFKVIAKLIGNDINVEVHDVYGNTPDSVTSKRIVVILSNAIVAVSRGGFADGMSDHELTALATEIIGSGLVDLDVTTYRTSNDVGPNTTQLP